MKRRKLPPGTRHHEDWCAVYRGEACNCDDDNGGPRYRRRPVAGGGGAPKREKKLEEA